MKNRLLAKCQLNRSTLLNSLENTLSLLVP